MSVKSPLASFALTIRSQYKAGKTQMELAAKYGVSQPAISFVIHGKTHTKKGGAILKAKKRTVNASADKRCKINWDLVKFKKEVGGMSVANIAEQLGYAKGSLYQGMKMGKIR